VRSEVFETGTVDAGGLQRRYSTAVCSILLFFGAGRRGGAMTLESLQG